MAAHRSSAFPLGITGYGDAGYDAEIAMPAGPDDRLVHHRLTP